MIRKVASFIGKQDCAFEIGSGDWEKLFGSLDSTQSIKRFLSNYYRYERGLVENEIHGFIGDRIHISIALLY